MKQTDFMNKIIDARCYFTSKCKISPRVIYFIQIISEQAESGWGVPQAGQSLTNFAKRGATRKYSPLHPQYYLKITCYIYFFDLSCT